jgi:hypothetical protein
LFGPFFQVDAIKHYDGSSFVQAFKHSESYSAFKTLTKVLGNDHIEQTVFRNTLGALIRDNDDLKML